MILLLKLTLGTIRVGGAVLTEIGNGRQAGEYGPPLLVGLPKYKHNDITVKLYGRDAGWWGRTVSTQYFWSYLNFGDTFATVNVAGMEVSDGFV